MKNIIILILLSFLFLWTACGNLEQEIDLELPEYEPKIVVECYLEPGQPFALLLTKSQSFFDPFDFELATISQILEDSATVIITHNGITYELENEIATNPPFFTKFYNYSSETLVPLDYENEFDLEIVSKNNEVITATTRLLPPITIDSLVVDFDPITDTLARTLTYFQDDLTTEDYYRRQLNLGTITRAPQQDFTTTDDFVEDGTIVFGGGYDFEIGDTVISTITHITKEYHDFLESISGAVDVNGNPFGQPGGIISNVESDIGALGIFTGISYDRIQVVVEK